MGNLGKWPRTRHGTWEYSPVMLAQRPAPPAVPGPPETQTPRRLWLLPPLLMALLSGCASGVPERAGAAAETFDVRGRIALAGADIALSEHFADGTAVPRAEWATAARLLLVQAAHEVLDRQAITAVDYAPATGAGDPDLPERLLASAGAGNSPADDRTATSVRNEVAPILHATGADYGLFIRLRGSHASDGRAAMRAAGRLLLGGNMGGDVHEGAATLLDLRSGRMVWHCRLSGTNADLRTLAGARSAVAALLAGLHGREPTPGP